MTSKEWLVIANQMALEVKKTKKAKRPTLAIETEQYENAARACAAIARLTKLAEQDAELSSGSDRLVGEAAGRAAVWGLVMQELDAL